MLGGQVPVQQAANNLKTLTPLSPRIKRRPMIHSPSCSVNDASIYDAGRVRGLFDFSERGPILPTLYRQPACS